MSAGVRCGCYTSSVPVIVAKELQQPHTLSEIPPRPSVPSSYCQFWNITARQTVRLTEVISHKHLVCQRMLRSYSNQWLGFSQSLEADGTAIGLAPLDLLLDVMEEGHNVAEAVLDIDVTVRDGD